MDHYFSRRSSYPWRSLSVFGGTILPLFLLLILSLVSGWGCGGTWVCCPLVSYWHGRTSRWWAMARWRKTWKKVISIREKLERKWLTSTSAKTDKKPQSMPLPLLLPLARENFKENYLQKQASWWWLSGVEEFADLKTLPTGLDC